VIDMAVYITDNPTFDMLIFFSVILVIILWVYKPGALGL
jgi:hypothetical protein